MFAEVLPNGSALITVIEIERASACRGQEQQQEAHRLECCETQNLEVLLNSAVRAEFNLSEIARVKQLTA